MDWLTNRIFDIINTRFGLAFRTSTISSSYSSLTSIFSNSNYYALVLCITKLSTLCVLVQTFENVFFPSTVQKSHVISVAKRLLLSPHVRSAHSPTAPLGGFTKPFPSSSNRLDIQSAFREWTSPIFYCAWLVPSLSYFLKVLVFGRKRFTGDAGDSH